MLRFFWILTQWSNYLRIGSSNCLVKCEVVPSIPGQTTLTMAKNSLSSFCRGVPVRTILLSILAIEAKYWEALAALFLSRWPSSQTRRSNDKLSSIDENARVNIS